MRASTASITLQADAPLKQLDDAVGMVNDQLRHSPPVKQDKKADRPIGERHKSGKELAASLRAPPRPNSKHKDNLPQLDLGLTPPDKKGPR
jgi:hypothetical protein